MRPILIVLLLCSLSLPTCLLTLEREASALVAIPKTYSQLVLEAEHVLSGNRG